MHLLRCMSISINTKYSCMYCTKCGAKLREAAKFCHACGQPVTKVKPAPADKTAVRSEIKENAVDLAKVGAKQILAALKDRDIDASATPGEVSCKPDAAQSAFMKMLKKGLLCFLILVGLNFSSYAESIFRGLKFDGKDDPEKGITLTVTGFDDTNDVQINGAFLNGYAKKEA